jgi:hypothetical protein
VATCFLKMISAAGDRQMLPRQTKSTRWREAADDMPGSSKKTRHLATLIPQLKYRK